MTGERPGGRVVLLTASDSGVPLARLGRGQVATAPRGRNPRCLIEVGLGRAPRPTLVHSAAAATLAAAIARLGPDVGAVARGGDCVVSVPVEVALEGEQGVLVQVLALVSESGSVVIAAAPAGYLTVRSLLDPDRAELVIFHSGDVDPVADLASREAGLVGFRVRQQGTKARRSRLRRRTSEAGQATPLVLGAALVAVTVAVGLAAIAGAGTGKGRAQRAADLGALSAARSMREDLPRLLAPAVLPNGLPNPAHMSKPVYLARARVSAISVAVANGGSAATVSVRFPDRTSFAPLASRVRLPVRGPGGPAGAVWAEARVGLAGPTGTDLAFATGGGYSGPLAVRQGHGMRPDVAPAFDRMAAAASRDGVTLAINSGYRSDAEQARLFAANPDPRWVAPPGRSLHRCGTELDIGPPSAYAWLATNAGRFGFLKRYSWEPWHFGFVAGPEPCSNTSGMTPGRERGLGAAVFLPEFVPARYRRAILSASLRTGVSAALLAAQLKSESNFDPAAVSPAGALGIAQFMPATAASRGLRDPFDPIASIGAQAELMAELIREFGSARLALAAYNAGPGAVGACRCVPPYPETVAYIARVLALAGGASGSIGFPMEVELVD